MDVALFSMQLRDIETTMSKDFPDLPPMSFEQHFLVRCSEVEKKFNAFYDFAKGARLRDERVKKRKARWITSYQKRYGANPELRDMPRAMRS